MGLYTIISTALTGIGYLLLTYKSSFILSQSPEVKTPLLQSLGMKWIVFLLFLMFQSILQAILDIVPFGCLALLAVKCMIVLPENTLATYIYQRIQRQLERMEFEQYNTKMSIYTSKVCKFITIKCILAAKRLAIYVKSNQLEEIYSQLENTLKALDYKRMTVAAKTQLGKSVYRRQLSMSGNDDSIASIDSETLQETAPEAKQSDLRESQVINRMSMIYLNPPQSSGSVYTVNADVMTVKPNKDKGIKPKYQKGKISFSSESKEVTISYESGREQRDILREIKYVKVNMMVIELILETEASVVIKFHEQSDVFPWVKPVMNCLNAGN